MTTTERMIPIAYELATRVHTGTRDNVNQLLNNLTTSEKDALTITLARMIHLGADHDRQLRPCGTHAAYVRHKNNNEPIDPWCLHAERAYQRNRKRTQRRAA